jgi:murein DD-endopeptidase MepM/ murein hydrolase activator NlpD
MSRDDADEASFDPKTWGAAASGAGTAAPRPAPAQPPAAAPTPGGVGESFDPRTWRRETAAAEAKAQAAETAAAPPPAAPPASRPAAAPGDRPPYLAATGACAAILLAGVGTTFALKGPAPAPLPAPTAAASAAPAPPPVVAQPPAGNASRRVLVIAGPAELGPTLAASGVPDAQVRAAVGAAEFALGKQPGEIRVQFDLVGSGPGTKLTRLEATRSDGAGVTLAAKPDGSYSSEVLQAQLTTQVKVVRGEMDATSFYNAAVNAGITDSLISDFAAAFSFDFDFQREVHPGDIFEAAFEQKMNAQGDPVGAPTLVYVSLTTQEKSKSLYRFLAPGDAEPGWYDGNGRSTVKALMRTPVDGARISSQFGFRIHPVLGYAKLHKGTDFAAPVGTPIFAAGSGVVEWAAMKGPNGNLTILRHDNGWQTYYLHQNMFMPGIAPGARVVQGQKIGEVGTTGRSTGPHLHYEVHIDGQAVNPMEIDTGSGKSLSGDGLAAFKKERDRIDGSRSKAI